MSLSPFKLSDNYVQIVGDRAEKTEDSDSFWNSVMTGAQRVDGWLVVKSTSHEDWKNWEIHPNGEELIMVLSGNAVLLTDRDGMISRTRVSAGETVIMPRGIWHRAEISEPTEMLFITYGPGTEHKPVGGATKMDA